MDFHGLSLGELENLLVAYSHDRNVDIHNGIDNEDFERSKSITMNDLYNSIRSNSSDNTFRGIVVGKGPELDVDVKARREFQLVYKTVAGNSENSLSLFANFYNNLSLSKSNHKHYAASLRKSVLRGRFCDLTAKHICHCLTLNENQQPQAGLS